MKTLLLLVVALTLAFGSVGCRTQVPSFTSAAAESASPVERTKAQIVGTWEFIDHPGTGFTYYADGTGVVFNPKGMRQDIKWLVTSKYDRPIMEVTSFSGFGMGGAQFVEIDGDTMNLWEPGTNFSANSKVKPDGILRRSTEKQAMGNDREKQMRTMGDMKTLVKSIEEYNLDEKHYPTGSSMDDLCKALTPDYVGRNCIRNDGWEHPFRYLAWGDDPAHPSEYAIASAGKEGRFEHEYFREYQQRETSDFSSDIVVVGPSQVIKTSDVHFIQAPNGKQPDGSMAVCRNGNC